MGLDEFCSSDQWSMLSSASTLASLAAALGAFLITAIAMYLKGEVRESMHTMALFSSAVLILVQSAVVLSLLAGTTVGAGDRREICAIAWTQGTLAIGMLAVGAIALFGGLGWMLAGHAAGKMSAHAGEDHGAYAFLAKLGAWLTFAAAMSTTLLMSEISIDFLHFMLANGPHKWLVGAIVVGSAAIGSVSLAFVFRHTRAADPPGAEEPTRGTLAALKIATVGVVVVGVAASWLALSLPRFPDSWLTAPSPTIVGAVLLLSFAMPGVIAVAICYSAPRATSA